MPRSDVRREHSRGAVWLVMLPQHVAQTLLQIAQRLAKRLVPSIICKQSVSPEPCRDVLGPQRDVVGSGTTSPHLAL